MVHLQSDPDLRKIEGKTVLVTGGTGFIGSHLVRTLQNHATVLVISRTKKVPGVRTINADIADRAGLLAALGKTEIDAVFHVAGSTNSPDHTGDPDFFSTNAMGTRNILELCRIHDIDQVVYSSTMEVFGDPLKNPVNEHHPKIPATDYGLSKWMGEEYCRQYRAAYGVSSTILRYSYVYGPGLPPYRVISRFIRNAAAGEPLLLNNGGADVTDYIFVGDVIRATILAATHRQARDRDFNIGGSPASVKDLAQEIIHLMGKGTTRTVHAKESVPKHFEFSIGRAKRLLRYNPAYSLRDGLKEQINDMIT